VQADPQRRASFVVHSAIASFYHKSFPALGSASQGVILMLLYFSYRNNCLLGDITATMDNKNNKNNKNNKKVGL